MIRDVTRRGIQRSSTLRLPRMPRARNHQTAPAPDTEPSDERIRQTARRAAIERRERPRIVRASKETRYQTMMTRTTTASVAGRSVAMRRMRRRASTATRPYCSTNGCTSFLVVDPDTNVASCPVCGFTRHMH